MGELGIKKGREGSQNSGVYYQAGYHSELLDLLGILGNQVEHPAELPQLKMRKL